MDYAELFGRLAFFSLLGLIASGVLNHCLENYEAKRGFRFSRQFWRDFTIGVWILVFAFGIGTDVWIVIKIVEWIGSVNE